MFKYTTVLFIIFATVVSLAGQESKQRLIQEADSIYQSNIKKTRLNGVYIPKDLDDAFIELDRLSPPESLAKIKSANENLVAKKLHFGLGRWMAVNWNFDEGSRFSHYLKGLGLYYSDDMIDFMLVSYHRYLNKKNQDIPSRVKIYAEKNALKEKDKQKNAETISQKKIK